MAAVDWKQFFVGGGDEQTLEFFPTVVYGDAIAVDPPDELFNEGVSDWKHSLVGQFIGPAPNFTALKKIVESLWGKSALAKVSITGPNLYVFSFADVAAKGLSYISSALGLPLYMDTVITARERLEFAKVCIEVEAGVKIPRTIPVIMRDKSVVVVKVKIPWMPSCCSHCKLFGHSDSTCLEVKGESVRHVVGSRKGPEWRVKSALVASSSVVVGAIDDSAIKAAFDPVVGSAPAAEAIGGDHTDVEFEVACNVEEQNNLIQVQNEKVSLQVDEFPPLQSPSLKKSKQRGGVEKPITIVGSKNKFEILNEITNEVVVEPRKPRVASLGVANLLKVVEKRDQLVKLQLSNLALPIVQGAAIAERQIQCELAELERAESKFYQQKAKVRWLNEGDQGTKLFHAAVAVKRRKNTINFLLDDEDNRLVTFDDIAEELIRFFTCQIGTIDGDVGGCSDEDLKDILQVVVPEDAQIDM
ncbi:hypothetical protein V6N13_139034 [Hibiscus sabdariffa]